MRAKLVAGGVAVALALAYLMYTALQAGAVYYLTVAELQAKGAAAAEERARVAGKVVPGSIAREGGTVRFALMDDPALGQVARPGFLARLLPGRGGTARASDPGPAAAATPRQLRVAYTGVVPDIFADGIDVIVEGRLSGAGVFDASALLARCPSRFEEAVKSGHSPTEDGGRRTKG